MIYIILFCLMWGWVAFKRADKVRVTTTLFFALLFLGTSQLFRLALYFLYPDTFNIVPFSQLFTAMARGTPYDLSMLCLFGGPILLLLNLPIRAKKYQRIVAILAILVWEFYSFWGVADLVYFSYSQSHIGLAIFDFFLSVSLIVKMAFYTYWPILLGVGICIVGGIYGVHVFVRRLPSVQKGPALYEGIWIVLLVVFLFFGERGYFFNSKALSPGKVYISRPIEGHLILNGVFSVVYSLWPSLYGRDAGTNTPYPSFYEIPTSESQQLTQDLLSAPGETFDKEYLLERTRTQFSYEKPLKNVIVLAIESFDSFSLDALSGTHYGATPNLDALARQGLLFSRFYSCSDRSSLRGVGAMMSGICKVSGIPDFSSGLEEVRQRGLGTILREAGYETVFVRACEDDVMYIGPLSRLLGFDSYSRERIRQEYGMEKVFDGDALDILAQRFEESKKPFAGFFFSTATHEPLGTWYPKHFSAELEQKFKEEPYLRALAYTDFIIGNFLRKIHEKGLDKDTLIIVAGDHPLRRRLKQDEKRFEVPLIISAPGVIPAGTNDMIAGQADILPTIIDLLHLSIPYSSMGKSIFAEPHKNWTFVHWMFNDDFGFITPQGISLSAQKSDFHRQMVALNKVAYLSLKENKWAH